MEENKVDTIPAAPTALTENGMAQVVSSPVPLRVSRKQRAVLVPLPLPAPKLISKLLRPKTLGEKSNLALKRAKASGRRLGRRKLKRASRKANRA